MPSLRCVSADGRDDTFFRKGAYLQTISIDNYFEKEFYHYEVDFVCRISCFRLSCVQNLTSCNIERNAVFIKERCYHSIRFSDPDFGHPIKEDSTDSLVGGATTSSITCCLCFFPCMDCSLTRMASPSFSGPFSKIHACHHPFGS